jgi:putative membrane protein
MPPSLAHSGASVLIGIAQLNGSHLAFEHCSIGAERCGTNSITAAARAAGFTQSDQRSIMKPSQFSLGTRRAAVPIAVLLAASLAGATPALAAAPTSEANFLQEAVHTDSSEAKIGQLAIEKSSSAGVKKLGRMLIDDHAATGQEATRLANTLQVSLPVDNGAVDQEAAYGALSSLSGVAFDRAFVDAVIESNQAAIAKYETQAQSGDSEVAAFAEKTLPVLEGHLRMARMLKMRLTEHNTP